MRLRPPTKRFREWCRRARKIWPLDKPVRIRRMYPILVRCDTCDGCGYIPGERHRCLVCRGRGQYEISGECWDAGSHYEIRIDRTLCRDATADTLIHEWCHLRRGEVDRDDAGEHDKEFWEAFGEMYRAWHRTR